MQNKQAILTSEGTYPVYNRANSDERLFLSDENYRYFLRKYDVYINPIADTFCYCLMPNHFHFLLRIKNEEQLTLTFNKQQDRTGSLFMKNFKRKLITDEDYFRKGMLYIHYNPVKAGLALSLNDWKYSLYRAVISKRETTLQRRRRRSHKLFYDHNYFKYCHSMHLKSPVLITS